VEEWSVRDDDRPLLRPKASRTWPLVLGVAVLAAAAGGFYYYLKQHAPRVPEAPPPALPAQVAPAPAPAVPQPAPMGRLEAPEPEAAKPLPTLDNSDSMMRELLAGLLGRKAFDAWMNPSQLIRNIVATVDNLPRPAAPRRLIPINPVPGAFAVATGGDQATLDPSNAARYAPYVQVMEAVNTQALVHGYVQAYPLFQQAYEQLGYPGKYFNDRLLETIDDLLAAPELDGPVKLARPKVLYEFADPDLQARSAGQKILMRIGRDNELKAKAKLREIRQEIARRSRQAR